jgi:hypothetical protein
MKILRCSPNVAVIYQGFDTVSKGSVVCSREFACCHDVTYQHQDLGLICTLMASIPLTTSTAASGAEVRRGRSLPCTVLPRTIEASYSTARCACCRPIKQAQLYARRVSWILYSSAPVLCRLKSDRSGFTTLFVTMLCLDMLNAE